MLIVFIMSLYGNGKKRRQDVQISNRLKQVKGVPKPTVEDIYPFDVPNLDLIPPEVKLYINELERQYIQRYNTLINNRIIYEQVIQNMSTQLEQKGVTLERLAKIYQKCITIDHKGKKQQSLS